MSRRVLMILSITVLSLSILAACASSPELPSQSTKEPASPTPTDPLPADDGEKQYKQAPDFEAIDSQGRTIRLSDYIGKKNLVIVINRGFG